MDSRDQTEAGFADPGTVGSIVLGLAGRAIVPTMRLLGATLQLARGVVEAIGPAAPPARGASSSARIHFPSERA